jgi:hypothetical protein
LGGCGQWFFPRIFKIIFGTKTLGKFLEKNSTNFAIFWEEFHQKNLYQKIYINMDINKKP